MPTEEPTMLQDPAAPTEPSAPRKKKRQLPALIRRFPSLFYRDKPIDSLVPTKERQQYPALAKDFEVLDQCLWPRFDELERRADRAQNRYRAMRVWFIVLGVLVTTLGAAQAAAAQAAWPITQQLALLQAVAAGLAVWASEQARDQKTRDEFFSTRLKAERLRGEYFLFLARIGRYHGADRKQQLIERVEDIVEGKDERSDEP